MLPLIRRLRRVMRVGIATVQVPFVWDPVTAQANELAQALRRGGHEAEIIPVPFKDYPPERIPEQMLACRLLDLDESMGTRIDRLIGLTFPAYLIPHSAKVIWLLRRHRAAYDLWDSPYGSLNGRPGGEEVRQIIRSADARLIAQARAVFVPSYSAVDRLGRECGLEALPLLAPPPSAELYRHQEDGDFFLLPGLAGGPLRSSLVIEAVRRTRHSLRVHVLGPSPDRAAMHDVAGEQRRAVFGACLAVVFPPLGEDDGAVALEAMLSQKPLVTCTDSGAVAELVEDGQTGFVRPPSPEALAEAMDRLWEDRELARRQGRAAYQRYRELNLSWEAVVDGLLA